MNMIYRSISAFSAFCFQLAVLPYVNKCHVCEREVNGAHVCRDCKQAVHFICGNPVPDTEEGFGQPVICFNCTGKANKPSNDSSSVNGKLTMRLLRLHYVLDYILIYTEYRRSARTSEREKTFKLYHAHLSMLSPRMGGGGQIPRVGKFDIAAILKNGKDWERANIKFVLQVHVLRFN